MGDYRVMGLPPGTEEIVLGASLLLAFLLIRWGLPWLARRLFGVMPATFSRKYLFSKANRNAVNIISLVAVSGIAVVTAAFILVLSAFNGFQSIVEEMYTSFDADLRIVPERGKFFAESDSLREVLNATEGVSYVIPVIEDRAMISFNDKQRMGAVKGIPKDYAKVNTLDSLVYNGEFRLRNSASAPMTVMGGGLAYQIQTEISDRRVTLWAAAKDNSLLTDPESAVRTVDAFVAGYFKVQMEYDNKYTLVDLETARELFDQKGMVSAYEIAIDDFRKADEVKKRLEGKLQSDLKVETWYEMHKGLFDVMKNEKLVAYLILTLMLLIAVVNIVGSLSMVVMEKLRDIAILRSLGAERGQIRRIFLGTGFFVGAIGGVAGVLLAYVAMLVHLKYGFLPFEGGEAFGQPNVYPFKLWWGDFVLTFVTLFCMAVLAALYPAAKAAATHIVSALRK